MDTRNLHMLESVAQQSAMGIPVHCVMSSVQRLRGLPQCLCQAMEMNRPNLIHGENVNYSSTLKEKANYTEGYTA